MKAKIQLVIENDKGEVVTETITCFEKKSLCAETMGLTLTENKTISAGIQKALVYHQTLGFLEKQRPCENCQKLRSIKDYHTLTYRTLFGKLILKSPRWYECDCQTSSGLSEKKSSSPLAKLLSERISPELRYLETKWASLMSYGITAELLEEVLPLQVQASSVFNTLHKVSGQLEKELGKEQYMYIEGCESEWGKLPRPDIPITVGIDGGYIHAREKENRKAGWFEVIVGKSMQEEHDTKRFGFVLNYDKKPKRRIYETLANQGLQMNQAITFLTDGGDTVRELSQYLSPQSEHILDWFHITMRITVMKQMAKSKKNQNLKLDEKLESIKWYLWHGNTYQALQHIEFLISDLECYTEDVDRKENKLLKLAEEFEGYISVNRNFIPNYGERYRYGEIISTAFVESTVNEIISKRMVKKQQMRWTQEGAHLLLQARVKTLNHELRQCFCRWYPQMEPENEATVRLAA